MGRELWITFSFLVLLVLRLSVSQPNLNSTQLNQLQTYFIELYQQYQQNVPAVKLELLMDWQLITLTHDIINIIRGWSPNEKEELLNVRTSTNYLRSFVLYSCILYVDSCYDSYSNAGGLDADVVFYATEIYQIRSNFLWTIEPSDEIVRFELAQFYQLGIRMRAINYPPYLELFSTNTESTRFLNDISAHNQGSFSVIFTPLWHNPQGNVLREVEMLINVQNILLRWSHLRNERLGALHEQLLFLNRNVRCALQQFSENFAWFLSPQDKIDTLKIITLIVLQRYMWFVRAEYDRHIHHPAHIKYANLLSANTATVLRERHIRLEQVYKELTEELNAITNNTDFLFEIRSRVSALPFRVGYVRYDGQLSLRIALSCPD